MLRVFRHYLSAPAMVLLCLEASVLLGVLYLATRQIGVLAQGGDAGRPVPLIVPLSLFASAVLCSIGMYDKYTLANHRRAATRLVVAFFICWPAMFLAAMAQAEAVPLVAAGATSTAMAGALASVYAARLLWSRASEIINLRRRVLVLGVGPSAARIEAMIAGHADAPLVLGYLRFRNEAAAVDDRRIICADESLIDTARRLKASEIVVAVDDRRGVPVKPLLECRLAGIVVSDQLSFWERETGKVMLDALSPSWLIYSDGFRLGSLLNRSLKRLLDITASVTVLALTLPVAVLAAMAIKLDSAGPIFYGQERVGLRGKVFTVYKFRSMRTDAEEDGVPRWASESDARVTRVGALLRKARIDEIPQVWNVLKGDMSFIGPRPERPFFVESLAKEVPYYGERARVRPGITGWAQINYHYGASTEDAREKLAYDLYYIKNYSLLLDILVLVGTVEAVLWPKGVR